jgi:CubicO group peptidase (beta-lactamase class C family)
MSVTAGDPAAVGMDRSRLALIGEYMDSLVDKNVIPCHQTLVARHGKVAYVHAGGVKNSGAKGSLTTSPTALQPDTIFRIYSMSKCITSVALMQLYEQGKFLLNHPIYLYLGPKWKKANMTVFDGGHPKAGNVRTVPCSKNITMLQVLTHTSGLTYGFDAEGIMNPVDAIYTKTKGIHSERGTTLESFCDTLAELPLLFQPGTCWNYGFNTDVCARLVEAISGQKFSDYLNEHIFEPLGMVDSSFWVSVNFGAAKFAVNCAFPLTAIISDCRTFSCSSHLAPALGCSSPK